MKTYKLMSDIVNSFLYSREYNHHSRYNNSFILSINYSVNQRIILSFYECVYIGTGTNSSKLNIILYYIGYLVTTYHIKKLTL